jgi:Na+-translocating ferredoxin:NAD+ oxidoreductase RnfC subunit
MNSTKEVNVSGGAVSVGTKCKMRTKFVGACPIKYGSTDFINEKKKEKKTQSSQQGKRERKETREQDRREREKKAVGRRYTYTKGANNSKFPPQSNNRMTL